MSSVPLIPNQEFHEIKSSVQADNRGRLTVGGEAKEKTYRVLVNEIGQILLDPIVTIPERELWLWKNQAALNSVQQGLKESANGELHDLGSFTDDAELEIED